MCRCDVQRRRSCGNHSGFIVKTIPGYREKPFAFPLESPFTFSPESCSPSSRNAFHVHPGIAFTLPRNPHQESRGEVPPCGRIAYAGGPGHTDFVTGVAATADARRSVSASQDHKLKVGGHLGAKIRD